MPGFVTNPFGNKTPQGKVAPAPAPEPTAGPFEDAFKFLKTQTNPDPGLLDRMQGLQTPQPPSMVDRNAGQPPAPDPRSMAIEYAREQQIAGLSPDQEPLQPLSKYYDEPRLQGRLESVIYTARQVTGGVLRPEVAWDLARSGLGMDQVAGVIRFMLQQAAPPLAAPPMPHRVDWAQPPTDLTVDGYPTDPNEDIPYAHMMRQWSDEFKRRNGIPVEDQVSFHADGSYTIYNDHFPEGLTFLSKGMTPQLPEGPGWGWPIPFFTPRSGNPSFWDRAKGEIFGYPQYPDRTGNAAPLPDALLNKPVPGAAGGRNTSLAHPYLTEAEIKAHLLAPTAPEMAPSLNKYERDQQESQIQRTFPQLIGPSSPPAAAVTAQGEGFVPWLADIRGAVQTAQQLPGEAKNGAASLLSWLSNNIPGAVSRSDLGQGVSGVLGAFEASSNLIDKFAAMPSTPPSQLIDYGGQNFAVGRGVVTGAAPPKVYAKGDFIPSMGFDGPLAGKNIADKMGVRNTSELLPFLAAYFQDPSINDWKGTWTAAQIAQVQEYMNAAGNQIYHSQVALQAAGKAGDLKPNGVVDPSTDIGQQWLQRMQEAMDEQAAQYALDAKNAGDIITNRDVPLLNAIHGLQHGRYDPSKPGDWLAAFAPLLPDVTHGMPAGLLSGFRLLQVPFAPFEWAFNAVPESYNLSAEVARDPRYAALVRQAIAEGKLAPSGAWKPGIKELPRTDDWQWTEANIHDQDIVNQIHQIALDKLQMFGIAGDPSLESFGVKHLGSITELIGNMMPYQPLSDQMVEWSHDHPVAETLASTGLILMAPVPKFGVLMKAGLGEERYFTAFSKLPGGLNPYLTKKFLVMSDGGVEPAQVMTGRMLFSGKVSGHFRGLTDDQAARLQFESPEKTLSQRANDMFGPRLDIGVDHPNKGFGDLLNNLERNEVPAYAKHPTAKPAIGVQGERTPEQLYADTLEHGGTRYQPKYQISPVVGAKDAGWMVGVPKLAAEAKTVTVPQAVFTPKHVADFQKANEAAWADQRNFVGIEKTDAGIINLDVARHTYNKNEAHALGVQHEQERVFDIAKGESPTVSKALANKVRPGREYPAGSEGPEGGQTPGQVLLQPGGAGRGSVAGQGGPTGASTNRSTARVYGQNLRQLTAIRDVVAQARAAGKDVKLTVNGRAADEVPMPVHIPTKQEYSDMIHAVTAEADRRLPGQIAVRPSVYARVNQAIIDHGHDPHYGWLIRSLAQKAYAGSLNFRDPSTIDKIISLTNNYAASEAEARKINQMAVEAYRRGSAGSGNFYGAVNLMRDSVGRHYALPAVKDEAVRPPFEAKGGWSAGVDEATGKPRTESIYDNAKKHEAYMSSLERASFVRPGDEARGLASKTLDSPGKLTLENMSWLANQAVFASVRLPATIFSFGLQNKVYLMMMAKVLRGEIPGGLKMVGKLEDRALGPLTKNVLSQAELGRLRYTYQQDFAHNAPAHFADYAALDDALSVGLGRVFSSSIYGVNKKIRNMKLGDAMTPEQVAAYETSLRMTARTSGERLKELELQEVPKGPAFRAIRDEKASLHQAINRAAYDRDALRAGRLPASVAEPLVEKAYRDWLQSPGGIDFQKASFSNADGTVSGKESSGELWTQDKIDRHVSAAMKQVNAQFINYPKVHQAFLDGESHGSALLKVASKDELHDVGSKASGDFWFSHDMPTEKSRLASWGDSAWAIANRASYYAFKRTKLAAFDRFTEANLKELWPQVESGRMTSYDAGFLAMQKARDQTYESLFNLQLSMTNAEQRLRFVAPFATKVRLYFSDLTRNLVRDPRYGAAFNNAITNFQRMNPDADQYNKYRVSGIAPMTIPGLFAKGDRLDAHIDNALWLGVNHELINAAIPQFLQDQLSPGTYDSLFGYSGADRNPYTGFFPRVGQEFQYGAAIAIADGKWFGTPSTLTPAEQAAGMTLEDKRVAAAVASLPKVDQNYINKRVNSFIYLHALNGDHLDINAATRAALWEELHFSTIKITSPFNVGVVSADQVEVERQLKELRGVTSHADLAALEKQYPQISELFHLTENPRQFKEFVLGQAGYNVVKQQYQDDLAHIQATWGKAALVVGASGWREAGQEYADANNVRNDAIAQLAQKYPSWGAFRGFTYQDAQGNYVQKDEGMSTIRQREALLQGIHKQWSQFKDDNMILPGSAKDREQIVTAINGYDERVKLLQQQDKIKNPTPEQKTITKEMGKSLFQFEQDFADILATYRPQAAGDTTLRDVKKSYFDNVYTPYFNAQTPIFTRLSDPLITTKEKGVLLDQLRNLKDTMNLSYTDPNFPGVKLPPPEQHQFASWNPVVQAQHVATWRFYAAHKPEWLTDWQTAFLQDPTQLAEALKGWDSTATQAYLDTLSTLQAKEDAYQAGRRGGFSFFQFKPPLSVGEQWRLNLKNRGMSGPNILAGRVPYQANPNPGNIIAPNAPAVFPTTKTGKQKH